MADDIKISPMPIQRNLNDVAIANIMEYGERPTYENLIPEEIKKLL